MDILPCEVVLQELNEPLASTALSPMTPQLSQQLDSTEFYGIDEPTNIVPGEILIQVFTESVKSNVPLQDSPASPPSPWVWENFQVDEFLFPGKNSMSPFLFNQIHIMNFYVISDDSIELEPLIPNRTANAIWDRRRMCRYDDRTTARTMTDYRDCK